ncbi:MULTISPECIES: hypothetical protein [unclassified Streptomyces]|uniref:hypothetical protein n=1 Tax=unclassified Streptomyces TaxID=2593676 RepID=UPI0036B227A6
MKDIHHALATNRGAAVAVARIEPEQKRVLFCGVGNIAAAAVTATAKSSLPRYQAPPDTRRTPCAPSPVHCPQAAHWSCTPTV